MSFHPDLQAVARWLPHGVARAWTLPLLSRLPVPAPRLPEGVTVSTRRLPGTTASVRVLRGPAANTHQPAILWIHGGGYVIGSAKQDDLVCAHMALELGAVVISVDYRLATHHPFPAPLDDCLAAWDLLHAEAEPLGVDPTRTVLAGQSAGAGLAAALAQQLVDTDRPQPLLQVLVYPMLDDRTALRDAPSPHYRLWDPTANTLGWARYLGQTPGSPDLPPYAAAARRLDLRGLPPAWIGVGSLDLFHDEDLAYADRLRAAGIPVELVLVSGAFHGFDAVLPKAPVSEAFIQSRLDAMRRALSATDRRAPRLPRPA